MSKKKRKDNPLGQLLLTVGQLEDYLGIPRGSTRISPSFRGYIPIDSDVEILADVGGRIFTARDARYERRDPVIEYAREHYPDRIFRTAEDELTDRVFAPYVWARGYFRQPADTNQGRVSFDFSQDPYSPIYPNLWKYTQPYFPPYVPPEDIAQRGEDARLVQAPYLVNESDYARFFYDDEREDSPDTINDHQLMVQGLSQAIYGDLLSVEMENLRERGVSSSDYHNTMMALARENLATLEGRGSWIGREEAKRTLDALGYDIQSHRTPEGDMLFDYIQRSYPAMEPTPMEQSWAFYREDQPAYLPFGGGARRRMNPSKQKGRGKRRKNPLGAARVTMGQLADYWGVPVDELLFLSGYHGRVRSPVGGREDSQREMMVSPMVGYRSEPRFHDYIDASPQARYVYSRYPVTSNGNLLVPRTTLDVAFYEDNSPEFYMGLTPERMGYSFIPSLLDRLIDPIHQSYIDPESRALDEFFDARYRDRMTLNKGASQALYGELLELERENMLSHGISHSDYETARLAAARKALAREDSHLAGRFVADAQAYRTPEGDMLIDYIMSRGIPIQLPDYPNVFTSFDGSVPQIFPNIPLREKNPSRRDRRKKNPVVTPQQLNQWLGLNVNEPWNSIHPELYYPEGKSIPYQRTVRTLVPPNELIDVEVYSMLHAENPRLIFSDKSNRARSIQARSDEYAALTQIHRNYRNLDERRLIGFAEDEIADIDRVSLDMDWMINRDLMKLENQNRLIYQNQLLSMLMNREQQRRREAANSAAGVWEDALFRNNNPSTPPRKRKRRNQNPLGRVLLPIKEIADYFRVPTSAIQGRTPGGNRVKIQDIYGKDAEMAFEPILSIRLEELIDSPIRLMEDPSFQKNTFQMFGDHYYYFPRLEGRIRDRKGLLPSLQFFMESGHLGGSSMLMERMPQIFPKGVDNAQSYREATRENYPILGYSNYGSFQDILAEGLQQSIYGDLLERERSYLASKGVNSSRYNEELWGLAREDLARGDDKFLNRILYDIQSSMTPEGEMLFDYIRQRDPQAEPVSYRGTRALGYETEPDSQNPFGLFGRGKRSFNPKNRTKK